MQVYNEMDVSLVEKWSPVLEAEDKMLAPIQDEEQRFGVARMLEATHSHLASMGIYSEATPTNQAGQVAGYDQVMGLVRRMGPTIFGNELVGIQPLTGPTGLVFAVRPRYDGGAGDEIHANTTRTAFTGLDSAGAIGGGAAPIASDIETDPLSALFTNGSFMSTAQGEGDVQAELGVTIDSAPVVARTRSLKSNYSMELVQDMASQHGIDGGAMFGNLMAERLTAEINYETLRSMYISAVRGAQDTTTPGTYDLTVDTDGRWIGEKGKILAMRIAEECSQIMRETRMGAGNFVVCDSRTYNLMYNAGLISDLGPSNSMFSGSDEIVKDTTVAVGLLNGKIRIYRDDNATMTNANEGFVMVGWKGSDSKEAGMFYCPYIPVWTSQTIDTASGQPIMFYKTRAGRVANPLANTGGVITAQSNPLYRIFRVTNILF